MTNRSGEHAYIQSANRVSVGILCHGDESEIELRRADNRVAPTGRRINLDDVISLTPGGADGGATPRKKCRTARAAAATCQNDRH